jgi:hypothetical protein
MWNVGTGGSHYLTLTILSCLFGWPSMTVQLDLDISFNVNIWVMLQLCGEAGC